MAVLWHALAFVTHERAKMSHKPGRNLTQAGPKCHTRAKMSHSHVIISNIQIRDHDIHSILYHRQNPLVFTPMCGISKSHITCTWLCWALFELHSLIARFMGPSWGPSRADSTQVGPILAPWTLLFGFWPPCGLFLISIDNLCCYMYKISMSNVNLTNKKTCSSGLLHWHWGQNNSEVTLKDMDKLHQCNITIKCEPCCEFSLGRSIHIQGAFSALLSYRKLTYIPGITWL